MALRKSSIRLARLAVLAALVYLSVNGGNGAETRPPTKAARLIALPVSRGGIADASLADTGPNGRIWMSYTAVDPSPRWPEENTRTETTRLAYSDDRGVIWKDLGSRVTGIKDVQFGSKNATWVNEVSSLLYDPAAVPQERWQLYWHHYLSIGDEGRWPNGWIGYKAAATPEGLITASEVKLFAGRVYDEANNDPSSETKPPVSGPPVLRLEKLHTDLSYCLALTEPGAMAVSTGIYMSLGCVQPRVRSVMGMLGIRVLGAETHIILLKCEAPCHPGDPNAWKYVNTPLTTSDAVAFGYKDFNAPDLFMKGNEAFLLISPGSDNPVPNAYNGCFVFRFEDLERGLLARGGGGTPTLVNRIEGRPNSFNGACTYQPTVPASGFIYMDVLMDGKPFFRLFQTGEGF